MNLSKKYFIHLFLLVSSAKAFAQSETIKLADPTIFHEASIYYLYGTGAKDGFAVYTSTDLKSWIKQKRNALLKGDSFGDRDFWAPQIFKNNGKYYMAYTADGHIAIAEGDSPLGPFTQANHKAISGKGHQIDPFIFKDSDGKLYLYYVRLQNGNRIYVARLKDDLSDIDEATSKECLHAESGWENTANAPWPVSEGPTVTKMDKTYYLFYSANDFRNIDYAVGYATSSSPFGPWVKYSGNPIISRKNTGYNGSGHGDLFTDAEGKLNYVFHVHNSNIQVNGPRKSALVELAVSKAKIPVISIIPSTVRLLETEK